MRTYFIVELDGWRNVLEVVRSDRELTDEEVIKESGLDIDLDDVLICSRPIDAYPQNRTRKRRFGLRMIIVADMPYQTKNHRAVYAGTDGFYADALDGTEEVWKLNAETLDEARTEAEELDRLVKELDAEEE